jgi:hypothetical protein
MYRYSEWIWLGNAEYSAAVRDASNHSGKVLAIVEVLQQTGLMLYSGLMIGLILKSGKLLDVYQSSLNDGGTIVQWSDTGGTNQLWQLVAN